MGGRLFIDQFLENPLAEFSRGSRDFPIRWTVVINIQDGRPHRASIPGVDNATRARFVSRDFLGNRLGAGERTAGREAIGEDDLDAAEGCRHLPPPNRSGA